MQAITVAISPAGISFFGTTLLGAELAQTLAPLKPPDATLYLGNVTAPNAGGTAVDLDIYLTQGTLSGLAPTVKNSTVVQGTKALGTSGQFSLDMSAPSFGVSYSWRETYNFHYCSMAVSKKTATGVTPMSPPVPSCNDRYHDDTYAFSTSGSLDVVVVYGFTYNSATNAWTVPVISTTPTANIVAGSPPDSVISGEGTSFGNEAADAVDTAFQQIDFKTSVTTIMPAVLSTIPASGHLTDNIVFGFAVGDSGIAFPNDEGIALGVTGTVSWKGTLYPVPAPAALPVPAVPGGGRHLQMYVADYAINGLYWAFYNDGRLTTTLMPADLADPKVLRVATYVAACPALEPYKARSMSALVTPLATPTVTFETVYVLSPAVLATLQPLLPPAVYTSLSDNMGGNAYISVAAIEADFNANAIPSQYFSVIEQKASLKAGAVTANLQFTLTILQEPDPAPYIEFSVQRTDVLSSFALGPVAGKNPVQTLQFVFHECNSSATFVKSNIANLGTQFPLVWPDIDAKYDELLQAMGKQGVALPIMAKFNFVFDQATLNVEQNYISITADVEFTP